MDCDLGTAGREELLCAMTKLIISPGGRQLFMRPKAKISFLLPEKHEVQQHKRKFLTIPKKCFNDLLFISLLL